MSQFHRYIHSCASGDAAGLDRLGTAGCLYRRAAGASGRRFVESANLMMP